MEENKINLRYDSGTIACNWLPAEFLESFVKVKRDERSKQWRLLAIDYRSFIEELTSKSLVYDDQARAYQKTEFSLKTKLVLREHQEKALEAWKKASYRGCVSLPTGGGKTILAIAAISLLRRSTLVIVPTLDLMAQWQKTLTNFLGVTPTLLGGGEHEISDLTVATYQSAQMHAEKLGNRFGLIIFDECHHLPSEQYQRIAVTSLAPFRLGLSATIERADGLEEKIFELVGPLVWQTQISEMIGLGLAPFETITLEIELTALEKESYASYRKIYLDFLYTQGISFKAPNFWQQFVLKASRSARGLEALRAFRLQKKIALSASGKILKVWELLQIHACERVIVFTEDNELAYHIGRELFLPVISHKTKAKERKLLLDHFRSGKLRVLVNSKVLNEGVDVPEASVAIVVSGNSTVREHVQRLGRILRESKGKRAVLYELIAKKTGEYFVNERRRQHHAYQESPSV